MKSSNKTTKKKFWFDVKQYGWGWYPVTREGWASVIGGIGIIVATAFLAPYIFSDEVTAAWMILSVTFLVSIGLVVLGYLKGPKPRWQWGKKSKNRQ